MARVPDGSEPLSDDLVASRLPVQRERTRIGRLVRQWRIVFAHLRLGLTTNPGQHSGTLRRVDK